MMTRDDAPRRSKRRKPTSKSAVARMLLEDAADDAGSPIFDSPLEEAIEAERAQLFQAHAVIKCLYEVLLYADGEDATLYADVAKLAAKLIDESVSRLEFGTLKALLDPSKARADESGEEKLGFGGRGKDEVRDGEGCVYLC